MAEGGITGKGFRKGDPRINRKGRPKSFDKLRELAQQIAHEATQVEVEKDGEKATETMSQIEYILRKWAGSANPDLQKRFVEVAFGKVPDEIVNNGEVVLRVKYDGARADRSSEDAPPETT